MLQELRKGCGEKSEKNVDLRSCASVETELHTRGVSSIYGIKVAPVVGRSGAKAGRRKSPKVARFRQIAHADKKSVM
jgi:hypothetical protein